MSDDLLTTSIEQPEVDDDDQNLHPGERILDAQIEELELAWDMQRLKHPQRPLRSAFKLKVVHCLAATLRIAIHTLAEFSRTEPGAYSAAILRLSLFTPEHTLTVFDEAIRRHAKLIVVRQAVW